MQRVSSTYKCEVWIHGWWRLKKEWGRVDWPKPNAMCLTDYFFLVEWRGKAPLTDYLNMCFLAILLVILSFIVDFRSWPSLFVLFVVWALNAIRWTVKGNHRALHPLRRRSVIRRRNCYPWSVSLLGWWTSRRDVWGRSYVCTWGSFLSKHESRSFSSGVDLSSVVRFSLLWVERRKDMFLLFSSFYS